MNTAADVPLKFPAPWPGGKSKVAAEVWARFGDVDNYVEAFAGTAAVLLRRPAEHFANGYRVETINDANMYVVNFFRAVTADPEGVARWADNPVHEADLHARHRWLVRSDESAAWKLMMAENPEYYDAKVAGWWCWGQCCWIGSGWCEDRGPASEKRPDLAGGNSDAITGLRLTETAGRPQLADAYDVGRGVNGGGNTAGRVPNLKQPNGIGWGVNANGNAGGDGADNGKRPQITDNGVGRGVNAGGDLTIQRPGLGRGNGTGPALGDGVLGIGPQASTCAARRSWLTAWMHRLADRLRLVRSCYGHWSRICDSDSTLTRLGTTGVFLDPPYPTQQTGRTKKSRSDKLYATDAGADLSALRDEVLSWCRKWGDNPQIRIAVCGYEGDGYEALTADGWTEYAWESSGGYGNQNQNGTGKAENAKRERIWFNGSCVTPTEAPSLFAGLTAPEAARGSH